ncbi:MAG: MBL fold metallo-hydrolase [Planctomycetota bacterium]|jgi:ribonuclease BN (tRNA processing enzyme)
MARDVRFAVACLFAFSGFVLGAEPAISDSKAPQTKHSTTKVVLLGTGTPNADPDRSGPATAVVVGDRAYLVDCGPGVVRRAAAAHAAGIDALRVSELKHLFVTHLHSDHTLGLPDLIFTPWVLERSEPLKAYGPPGLKNMTDFVMKAFAEDVNTRLHGLEPANAHGYQVDVTEFGPGIIFEDDRVKVIAFPVDHGSWKHAYGFRFETADRVIVISGDTRPSEHLVENAKGCDVLVHEVYSVAGFARRDPVWQKYHSQFHTSTAELAEIANRVQPKLLVLTHLLFWGESPESMLAEIKQHYKGEVRCGSDLDVY